MEKKNWDDIPSLDGLGMDWDYQPENPLGKRAATRMQNIDLSRLFEVRSILVKVVSAEISMTGILLDISEKGIGVHLQEKLSEHQPVKIGLFLGTEKIISRGEVVHVRAEDGQYATGIRFVDLDEAAKRYIVGLYASKVLKHSI